MTMQWDTRYPNVRSAMESRCASLSDAEIEAAFANAFGERIGPAEYEEFFGSIGQALQRAAPVLQSVASGATQGAMASSALGPYGMIGGALAGGLGSALSQHTTGPARQVGQVLSGGVNLLGGVTGGGGLGSLLGGGVTPAQPSAAPPTAPPAIGGAIAMPVAGGGGSASRLLSLLSNPAVLTALQSLARGSNPPVQVGQSALPASELAELVGSLAHEAVSEAESRWGGGWHEEESWDSYMDSYGDLLGDSFADYELLLS